MASIGELFKGIGINISGGAGFMASIVYIVLGTVILFVCGFAVYWLVYRKIRYNLKVEFKIPRNVKAIRQRDGVIRIQGTINKEWGKGFYNSKTGVVLLKRKRKKPCPMKPFDIKQFLSADNILTVIQVGMEDYRPVLDDSYIEVVDENGQEAALIRCKIDTSEGKAWRNSYERERKNTYTIMNWLREHGQILAFGLMAMMILVGFAILWTRIPKICGSILVLLIN